MFTEDEKRFLDALEAALVAARKSPAVNITRMADKALSVRSRHGYLGENMDAVHDQPLQRRGGGKPPA